MSPSLPLFQAIRKPLQQSPWYVSVIKLMGWVTVVGGLHAIITSAQHDVAWGLLLIAVGLLMQRVASGTALAMFGSTLIWASIANWLFGREMLAMVLGTTGLVLLLLGVSLVRQRGEKYPLPALAWATLWLGVTGLVTLIIALGGSLIASLTGWALDARVADALAAGGAHQAALASILALGVALQPSRNWWAAVLGGLAGVMTLLCYILLLLVAQG